MRDRNKEALRRGWKNEVFVGIVLCVVFSAGCAELKRFAYEGTDRDTWQRPDQVIHALGLPPGGQVADIGAGGGYFTLRLADAVGPSGRVYAVDVDSDMVEYLEKEAREKGYENVEAVLAKEGDPLLPQAQLDLIFLCNTYHHLPERADYFRRARKYLRAGGRVVIIDFNDHALWQRWFGHSVDGQLIRSEFEAAGYRLEHEYDFLPEQHFLVFATAEE
jgi:ubiquinone/menaquinone biosynthesis C-methylase UbiE